MDAKYINGLEFNFSSDIEAVLNLYNDIFRSYC